MKKLTSFIATLVFVATVANAFAQQTSSFTVSLSSGECQGFHFLDVLPGQTADAQVSLIETKPKHNAVFEVDLANNNRQVQCYSDGSSPLSCNSANLPPESYFVWGCLLSSGKATILLQTTANLQ